MTAASAAGGGDERLAELAGRLGEVRSRLTGACAAAGRARESVTLVAVTKTFPPSDVLALARLGVRDIGENRDAEAAPKAAAVAEALQQAGIEIRWHFVGRLQRNKCRSVARYADVVHSVDRVRLATALDRAAHQARDRPLDTLVQVSLDGDPARGGAFLGGLAGTDPDRALPAVLAAVAAGERVRLRGVMAVAPLDWPPERAYQELAEVAERVRAEYPQATEVSAGMSGDLEVAVRWGATQVRIGTALLGQRPDVG